MEFQSTETFKNCFKSFIDIYGLSLFTFAKELKNDYTQSQKTFSQYNRHLYIYGFFFQSC